MKAKLEAIKEPLMYNGQNHLKIIHLEDNPSDAELVARRIEGAGLPCEWRVVSTRDDFVAALDHGGMDLIISDFTLPSFDGLSALEIARNKAPECPFIFVSGSLGEELAVESLKRGAKDYVIKDQLERLPNIVRQVLHAAANRDEQEKLAATMSQSQSMETVAALVGGIAHDLNEALSPVLGWCHLLQEPASGRSREISLDAMRACVARSREMLEHTLGFARGIVGEPVALDMGRLVEESAQLTRQACPPAISIETAVDRDVRPVIGNAAQIKQVLLNLCLNARNAMPCGGRIQIAIGNADVKGRLTPWHRKVLFGPFVVVTVSDNGCGMPAGVTERLLTPHFTGGTIGKGLGLGLATVEGIVKSHGGFVEIASEPAKGTDFKLYLPADAKTPPQQKAHPPGARQGNGHLILVVDDEPSIVEMTRSALEMHRYRVLTARDGAAGLSVYRQHRSEIRAVITDMFMPVMSGPAMIRSIQAVSPHVKVIGLSGLGTEAAEDGKGSVAMHKFLSKPFSIPDLLTALEELLGPALPP